MELPAVIFPDTVVAEGMLFPLVPVFAPLVYLQPVENDPPPVTDALDVELRQSFCRAHVPAPLGPDRERFLRLVSDIRNRRDDYAAQLGHQTLAGISAASSRRSETKSSIVGSLLAGHGIREAADDRRNLLLWQSRLLLKLAEMHAADQAELQQQMQRIREKEQGMFAGLREEKGNLFALSGELAAFAADPAASRQQRKAWTRLLVLGEAWVEETHIYISRDRDSIGLLAEAYEKSSGRPPVHLGQLFLPAVYRDRDGYVEQVRQFRAEGADLLARVQRGLDPMGTGPAVLTEEEQRAWSVLLEKFFPAAECGRTRLTVFACPGCSPRRLFAETFAPEEEELLSTPGDESGVILCALEEG